MNTLFGRIYWGRLAEGALVAVMVVTPIMMSGVMLRGYEISKLAVAEPLSILALCAALLAGLHRHLVGMRGDGMVACAALASFLVIGAVSTVFSETPAAAIFGGYYRREGMLAWIAYAAVFFSLFLVARSERQLDICLDALLLASVVPCVYAIEQRFQVDFFSYSAGQDITRPTGTLGNPVFLAAYLALLIPISVARCWQQRQRIAPLLLWAGLALLQFVTVLMTQTRGPILALFGGLVLFGACIAAVRQARRFLVIWLGVFAAGLVALVTLNTVPAAARWAGNVPVLSRLVFSLDKTASSTTHLASRSASARLGIWQAGTVALFKAPIEKQLIGYGPESAFLHYFSHMPEFIMRVEGYSETHVYDRLHADALDIGLNFGVLGWLAYLLFFCSVVYASARALFGLAGFAPVWIFAGAVFWGGSFSAAAAIQAGLPAAVVPAFTLGVGAGWFAFLLGCAWRRSASRTGLDQPVALDSKQWYLLAALTCAIVVFWMDAQINIPVMTTRFVSFGMAALSLAIAARRVMVQPVATLVSQSSSGESREVCMAWSAALAMTAALASFLPSAYAPVAGGELTDMLAARLLAVACTFAVAMYAAWVFMGEGDDPLATKNGRWAGIAGIALVVPLIYGGLHWIAAVDVAPGIGIDQVRQLILFSLVAPCFVFLSCLLRPLIRKQSPSVAHGRTDASPKRHWRWIAISAVAVGSIGFAAWISIAADVAAMAAGVNHDRRKYDLSEVFFHRAVQLMPHERQYLREWMALPISNAFRELNSAGDAAAGHAAAVRNIALGESRARENLARWPNDPWSVYALAGVLRLKALPVLRPLDVEGGAKTVAEARSLFLRAHQMFPTQPLFLRDWARFETEDGGFGDAAQLLERMESIIPSDPAPYLERIALAKKVGDAADLRATLERAKAKLSPEEFQSVEVVAKKRQ